MAIQSYQFQWSIYCFRTNIGNLGPVQFILKPDANSFLVVLQYLYVDICSKAIYTSLKLIGLYCHILYIFKHWPGLFNNGVPIYREYLLKGEALYDVFILLVCLNVLHIADGCLRIAYNQTRTWSQINDNWLLQFIAKGVLGNRSSTAAQFLVSSPKPPYDLNFKKGYFKTNCLLKHSCMKCEGIVIRLQPKGFSGTNPMGELLKFEIGRNLMVILDLTINWHLIIE
jgi:hypothetical protein